VKSTVPVGAGASAGVPGAFETVASSWTDVPPPTVVFVMSLPAASRTTVVTVSEFGRRVAQNGSGGVDHGHGSVMMVLGGGIVGGRVYGRWPGLAPAQLDNGDLRPTTDYRDVLGELVARRLGGARVLKTVFPDHRPHELGLAR